MIYTDKVEICVSAANSSRACATGAHTRYLAAGKHHVLRFIGLVCACILRVQAIKRYLSLAKLGMASMKRTATRNARQTPYY